VALKNILSVVSLKLSSMLMPVQRRHKQHTCLKMHMQRSGRLAPMAIQISSLVLVSRLLVIRL
jgi:hypothetical protein